MRDYHRYELNHFDFENLISEMERIADDAQFYTDESEWLASRERYDEIWEEAKQVGNVEGSAYRYEGRRSDETSGLWDSLTWQRERYWDQRTAWYAGKYHRVLAERRQAKAAQDAANAPMYRANIQIKEQMLARARTVGVIADPFEADKALEALLGEWKKIGKTGRRPDPLDDAFHGLRKAVKARRDQRKTERGDEKRRQIAEKQAIVARAQALVIEPDRKAAGREINELFDKLKACKGRDEGDDEIWRAFKEARNSIKNGSPPAAAPPTSTVPPAQPLSAPPASPGAAAKPPLAPIERPVQAVPVDIVRPEPKPLTKAFPPPPQANPKQRSHAGGFFVFWVISIVLLVPGRWSQIATFPDIKPPPRRAAPVSSFPALPLLNEIRASAPAASPPSKQKTVPVKPKPKPKPRPPEGSAERSRSP